MFISIIRTMRQKAKPSHFKDIDLVLTLAEATRQYNVHRMTLTYAIDAGLLAGMRCGRTVLISRRSLHEYLYSPKP